MTKDRPDYFAKDLGEVRTALMRVKGNWRRLMVVASAEAEGKGSVPPRWLEHDISEQLKGILQSRDPRARGGEDLPNLEVSEVEIARLTLLDSVHGEVTSLRARPQPGGRGILIRMVDEYETEFELANSTLQGPLTAGEVVQLFETARPSPTDTQCEYEITSFFYPELRDPQLGRLG